MLRGNELNVVSIYYRLLELASELGIDWMNDIAVCSVGIFSLRHNYEVSVSRVYNLNVVYRETVVEGYRSDSLHRSFLKEFSDFDICDLHNRIPFLMVTFFLIPNILYCKNINNIHFQKKQTINYL
jgi:hypothetical protein